MDKCLVTQLKGAVEESNIPVLGQLILKVKKLSTTPATAQCRFHIGTDREITVRVKSPGYFATTYAGLDDPATRLTSLTINNESDKNLWFANDDYDILIDNKYDITYLENHASTSSAKGIISADLEDLSYLTKATGIRFAYSDTDGDIKSLARLINMTEMGLPGTQCYGEVEDFVAGQILNGRETEETGISCFALLSYAKFGGSTMSIGGAQLLTWKSATNIAVFNATSIEAATTVYAKGATAGEIAAWEAAGKTVVVVN